MHFVLKAKYFFIMILVRRRNFFALFELETSIASFSLQFFTALRNPCLLELTLYSSPWKHKWAKLMSHMQVSPSIHKERNTKNVSVGTGGLVECTTAKLHGNLFNIF